IAEENAESRGEPGNYRVKIQKVKGAKGKAGPRPTCFFRAGQDDDDYEPGGRPGRDEGYDEEELGTVAITLQQTHTMLHEVHDMNLKLIDRVTTMSKAQTSNVNQLNTTIEVLSSQFTL